MVSMLVLGECEWKAFPSSSMLVLVAMFFSFPNMEGGYACLQFHVYRPSFSSQLPCASAGV